MATRPKAVIESRNGEKFSPITIAKNVLTDDGQNLHDILSDRKEDMITPTIENSSSMSKVGQGDNVDFSDNVVNGAYESMILKGRSLVNLINFSNSAGSANANKNGDTLTITAINNDAWSAHSFELNGMSHDKTYIACWDNLTFTHSHEDGKRSVVGIYASDDEGKQVVIAEINRNQSFNYLIFTLPSKVSLSKKVYFRIHATTWEGELGATTTIKGAKVLEYIEDMENWNIPYFEGMKSVQMPVLKTVGKNLFDGKLELGGIDHNTGALATSKTTKRNVDYITVKPNTQLSFSVNRGESGINWFFYDVNENYISNTFARTVTSPPNAHYLCFYNLVGNVPLNDYQIMIAESTAPVTYEPYKSNTTTFDQKDGKTIVLRSLPNGVCDTLNVNTGEYVQRIGEIVLDENELLTLNNNYSTTNTWCFDKYEIQKGKIYHQSSAEGLLCDRLMNKNWIHFYSSKTDEEGAVINRDYGVTLHIKINKNKLHSPDSEGLRAYLSSNPITIQYELATPIVKQVNVEGYPYAYKDGHVLLESGSQEQSLTPTIEYSIVANRGGQIRSNQKMVERHQKQLDRLQTMVLTNLVNTQYEQTLTNLKYDLKNVREEVK